MGVRDFLAQEIEYKWGAVLVSIFLIIMIFPFANSAGEKQSYGAAWAFGGGLRTVDETIINLVTGNKAMTGEEYGLSDAQIKAVGESRRLTPLSDPFSKDSHPFFKIFNSPQKVAVSLFFFVIGGFLGSIVAGEFGIKYDKEAIIDSVAGGFLMGIGIAFMTQCNVGVFMGATTQLALGSYIAIIGLVIGTYIGAKYYEKKMGL